MSDSIETIIPVPLVVSENAFVDWLFTPDGAGRLVYHRGFLARDTDKDQARMSKPERLELLHIARRAMANSDNGVLCLVQQRHGVEDYSYVAVKRKPKQKKSRRSPQ